MDCWHHEIDRARTEDEVVRKASDYLFLWAPQELAPLTQGWREIRVETAADIERVKRWLTESLAGAQSMAPYAAQLRELANYFWHAAARIAEIRAHHSFSRPFPLLLQFPSSRAH
jgi:hypothetical protein